MVLPVADFCRLEKKMIKTVGLTKIFDKVAAVNDLDLEIKTGEIFGFLGPNGAGKTTTIKLMTGLLRPTNGEALINSLNIQKDALEIKKMIGYIPEQPFVYPKLTGEELLKFVANLYEVKDPHQKIDKLISIFELNPYRHDMIEGYSHGMCQKLVISACLLHEPKVIFVDEPIVGLDPKSIRLVKDVFKENARRGVTIFMSTHTLDLAQDICTHIGIINNGRLIAEGTLQELQKSGGHKELEDVFLQLTRPEFQDKTLG